MSPGPSGTLFPGTLMTRRPGSFTPTPPPPDGEGGYILQTSGFKIALAEGGGFLLLTEGEAPPPPPPEGNYILMMTGDRIILAEGGGFLLRSEE